MKKRIIISIGIIALLAVAIILLNNRKPNPNIESLKEQKSEEIPIISDNFSVNIFDGKADKSLNIDGIKIDNIFVINENEKQSVYFEMSTETKDLNNLKLTLMLINSTREDSGNAKTINFNQGDSNHKKVSLDITNIYNNPKQLKFILE